ncbi:MAG: hypothetical protein GY772_32670 [bacterium]|nr:hypothetical protein [bacterium]
MAIGIDLSSWSGAPASKLHVDEWVSTVRSRPTGFDSTQHLTASPPIGLDGDDVHCTSDVQASHRPGDRRVDLGGWYDTRLRQASSGWRFASSTLHVTWRKGPEELSSIGGSSWVFSGSDCFS